MRTELKVSRRNISRRKLNKEKSEIFSRKELILENLKKSMWILVSAIPHTVEE
jgi:hypothetical protein